MVLSVFGIMISSLVVSSGWNYAAYPREFTDETRGEASIKNIKKNMKMELLVYISYLFKSVVTDHFHCSTFDDIVKPSIVFEVRFKLSHCAEDRCKDLSC